MYATVVMAFVHIIEFTVHTLFHFIFAVKQLILLNIYWWTGAVTLFGTVYGTIITVVLCRQISSL